MDATSPVQLPVPTGWTGVVVLIVLGVIGMAWAAYGRKKENEKIVTTNPDEPDVRDAIAERIRLQESTDASAESERGSVLPAGGDKNP